MMVGVRGIPVDKPAMAARGDPHTWVPWFGTTLLSSIEDNPEEAFIVDGAPSRQRYALQQPIDNLIGGDALGFRLVTG